MPTTAKTSDKFPASCCAHNDNSSAPAPALEATILDQLPAFIFLVADDYSIQYANRAFAHQFGSIKNTGLCHALIRANTEPCDDCPLTSVFRDRQKHLLVYEDAIRGKIYEFHYSPYLSNDGRTAALILGIDITDKCREGSAFKKHTCDENIIRICSHCKSIHTKAGIWQRVESYMCSKSDIQFSHGICPLCMEKHHPGIKWKKGILP
jgi:hypothetical protein